MKKLEQAVNYIGFLLLAGSSYGYAVFGSCFAERHWQPVFVNFPIFIGEILLVVCFGLLLFKLWLTKVFAQEQAWGWGIILILYLGFILAKAFYGYAAYGPLAFRHAALFYYSFFCLIGYYFLDRRLFTRWFDYLVIYLIFASLYMGPYIYYLFPILIIGIIFILRVRNPWARSILFGVLLWLFPYESFFDMGRTRVVSHTLGFITLVALYISISLPWTKRLKLCLLSFLTVLIVCIIVLFADKTDIKSITSFRDLYAKWKHVCGTIDEKEENFQFDPLQVRLYNSNEQNLHEKVNLVNADGHNDGALSEIPINTDYSNMEAKQAIQDALILSAIQEVKEPSDILSPEKTVIVASKEQNQKRKQSSVRWNSSTAPGIRSPSQTMVSISASPSRKAEPFISGTALPSFPQCQFYREESLVPLAKKQGPRSLDTAYNNILFRFFIWGDVWKELKLKKPLLGVDFGFPFRSRSLEVLGWADDAWRNDGWIAVHNSYLDLIYRAGLVGIMVVLFIFVQVSRIIYWTIKNRNRMGILISGLLVYWLCVANFTEFLELPYTAIVFWIFLGMTLAYFKKANQSRAQES